MKKIIPFIFPLITGLFGGWFIECILWVASIIMSPFGDLDQFNFFLFCGIVSLVSLLIIIVATIVNISFFIELSNKKKCMLGLIVQVCTTIFICLVSWHCVAQVINVLYKFFWNLKSPADKILDREKGRDYVHKGAKGKGTRNVWCNAIHRRGHSPAGIPVETGVVHMDSKSR